MTAIKVSELNVAHTPYDGTEYSLGIQDNYSVKIPVPNLVGAAGATLIGITPSGTISANTVAGALNELDTEKASIGSVALKADTSALAASTGATLVGTIQTGTGAVARTVDAKLKETVSVKDFGAVGDGVTDDTVAIQAAINHVKTVGGNLIVPSGVYITTQLNIGSGLNSWSLIGTGQSNTVFKHKTGYGTLMFGTSSIFGFTLQGFSVDCMYAEYSNVSANHGIAIEDTSRVRIKEVIVTNYKNTGILIAATVAGAHKKCIVEDCEVFGLSVAANGLLMVNMWESGYTNCSAYEATSSPGYGIQFKNNCKYCFILDCYSEGNRAGFGFGQEGGNGVDYSTCSNLRAVGNVVYGFVFGYANYNKINNLYVDCTNNLGASAVSLQDSVGNSVSMTAENIGASQNAIVFEASSTHNYVELTNLNNMPSSSYAASFATDTQNNTVDLRRSQAPEIPLSTYIGAFSSFTSTANNNIFRHTAYPNNVFLYIVSDTITVKNLAAEHLVLDTEALAATDDLSTITADTKDGRLLYLRTVANARDITVKHNVGNILLANGTDVLLNHTGDTLCLRWNGSLSAWTQVGFASPI